MPKNHLVQRPRNRKNIYRPIQAKHIINVKHQRRLYGTGRHLQRANMKNYKRSISKFLRTQKQALFTGCLFLIAAALLFGIFSQFQPPAVAKPVPEGVRVVDYSTFVGQVKAGNVLAVIMQGDDIHSLLVQPFLAYSSASSSGVAGSSQREATDIATWNRYVRAGYSDLSQIDARAAQSHKPSTPPIDLQRALYTHLPEGG